MKPEQFDSIGKPMNNTVPKLDLSDLALQYEPEKNQYVQISQKKVYISPIVKSANRISIGQPIHNSAHIKNGKNIVSQDSRNSSNLRDLNSHGNSSSDNRRSEKKFKGKKFSKPSAIKIGKNKEVSQEKLQIKYQEERLKSMRSL